MAGTSWRILRGDINLAIGGINSCKQTKMAQNFEFGLDTFGDVTLGPDNQPTKYSPDSGNACVPTPWEAVERTFINALTTGGALETATTTR